MQSVNRIPVGFVELFVPGTTERREGSGKIRDRVYVGQVRFVEVDQQRRGVRGGRGRVRIRDARQCGRWRGRCISRIGRRGRNGHPCNPQILLVDEAACHICLTYLVNI